MLVHGIVQADSRPAADTRERVRLELSIPSDAVVAMTVANLRRERDYPNLLRAADIGLRKEPRLVVVAVGQGPLVTEVSARRHSLDFGGRFKFLGYRSDVAHLMAASDLFVLASAFDRLRVSIMEAMAAGLLVVATAVGACRRR